MRRSRWGRGLRISGLVVATLVVILGIVWTIADVKYGRLLERELANLRRQGYPLTIAEARPKPVPDAQNAALDYAKVFGDLHFYPPTERAGKQGLERYVLSAAGRPDMPTALASRKLLESPEVRRALTTLEQASLKPKCVFPIPWEKGPAVMFPHLPQFRQGARLLAAQALLDAHDGNLPRALDRLAVSYRMADHVAQEPMLIQQLTAYAIRAINDRAAQEIVCTASPSPAQAASLAKVLRPQNISSSFETTLRMEFTMSLNTFTHYTPFFTKDEPDATMVRRNTVGGRLLAPYLNLENANFIHYFSAMIEQSKRPYRETVRLPMTVPEHRGFGTIMASMLVPVFAKLSLKRDQSLAGMHLLQTVLALKSHRHQHGQYPASLDALPPGTPTEDPLSGRPLGYRREGKGFRLYSVGPNLKDDGGKPPSERKKMNEEGDMVWVCPR